MKSPLKIPSLPLLLAGSFSIFLIALSLNRFVASANAAVDVGLNATPGLAAAPDIRVVIARIISYALGFLGIIAVSLVLYGGFSWMTAGGDQEKITKAKQILINAAIGLAIILSSWAITYFVLTRLIEATGGGPAGGGGAGGGGGFGGGGRLFAVQEFSPRDPAPPNGYAKNSPLVIYFKNGNVDGTTANADNISIRPCVAGAGGQCSGTPVIGNFTTVGSTVTFRPTALCPEDSSLHCFSPNTIFEVRVMVDAVKSITGNGVSCAFDSCEARFTIGNYIDVLPPTVSIQTPYLNQNVDPNGTYPPPLRARADDAATSAGNDGAVGAITFFDNQIQLAIVPASGGPAIFSASTNWTAQAPPICRTIGARAVDVAGNNASAEKQIVIRPSHCFDEAQNYDETGIDCGGDPTSTEYCGKCTGETCNPAETECALFCRTGFCIDNACAEQPIIQDVTPKDANGFPTAAPGSYLTIQGLYFGTTPGRVTFLGELGSEDDIVAELAPCATPWTSTTIKVVVPEDVPAGPIQVTVAAGLTDDTANALGFQEDFIPGTIPSPGICGIAPTEGLSNQTNFILDGFSFGDTQGTSIVEFEIPGIGGPRIATVTSWSTNRIDGRVPIIGEGMANVRVKDTSSTPAFNPSTDEQFRILPEATAPPHIDSISPTHGPSGTYVTIRGRYFGTAGQVIFTSEEGYEALGDTDFPPGCDLDAWRDDEIVIKIPSQYLNAEPDTQSANPIHKVRVERANPSASTAEIECFADGILPADFSKGCFTADDSSPLPGLCRIDPVAGPLNTLVQFFGERLGNASSTIGKFTSSIGGDGYPVFGATSAVESDSGDAEIWVKARVPSTGTTAISGPVKVTVGSVDSSNTRDYRVADCRTEIGLCAEYGANFQCCSASGTCSESCVIPPPTAGGFSWYLSTGPIPQVPRLIYECNANGSPIASPSPYADRPQGQSVCNNANIVGRFDARINASISDGSCTGDFNATNIIVKKCSGLDRASCKTTSDDSPIGGSISCLTGITDSYIVGFRFDPTADLDPSSWYEVKLKSAIAGHVTVGGANLLEDSANCGPGFAYCWQFKTRSGTENCDVGSLGVEPPTKIATELHEAGVRFDANCMARGDVCQSIGCPSSISWSTADPNASKASVSPNSGTYTNADPQVETIPGYVNIKAAIGAPAVFGQSRLTIDFIDPEVVEYAPNCQAACINTPVKIRFNTNMCRGAGAPNTCTADTNSVTLGSNIQIWKCSNGNCSTPESQVAFSTPSLNATVGTDGIPVGRWLTVTPSSSLSPNTYYRVLLKGSVESNSGVSLVGENFTYPAIGGTPYFSWIFRTKNDGQPCSISSVEMNPPSATVNLVGMRVAYTAIPRGAPDECSPRGQELTATEYNWGWVSGSTDVAQIIPTGGFDAAAAANFPRGCSTTTCLHTGSGGIEGQIALCGNGTTELELGEECDGGTGCNTTTCLYAGNPTATCGDGTTEAAAGEECDDENTTSGDGCSSNCLHDGTAKIGLGACGNGVVDTGEDCDPQTPEPGCVNCLRTGAKGVYGQISLCGNGDIEPGEDCDDGDHESGDGCSSICLNEGVRPGYWTFEDGTYGNCGNGTINIGPNGTGEECDDNNTTNDDGCSSRCLLEGSSPFYGMSGSAGITASFCGDGGELDNGEECEVDSTGGNDKVEPTQIFEAMGDGDVDTDGSQSTTITATASSISSIPPATFKLQCGFTTDSQCTGSDSYGVGANSCCSERPNTVVMKPLPDFEGACRNPMIRADFNKKMDLATFTGKVTLAREKDTACVSPETEVTFNNDEPPTEKPVGVFGRIWQNVKSFFRDFSPFASAHSLSGGQHWCASPTIRVSTGGVNTDATHSSLLAQVNTLLEPDTWYRVKINGDTNISDGTREGVLSADGVGMDDDRKWEFKTGTDVCQVDAIEITGDTTFDSANTAQDFTAVAMSRRGPVATEISPIPTVYDWTWQTWTLSAKTNDNSFSASSPVSSGDDVTVTSGTANGTGLLGASLKITADQIHPAGSSTVDKVTRAATSLEVFICENPTGGISVRDILGGNVDPITSTRDNQPYGNFSTRYCLDSGNPDSTVDDFPSFSVAGATTVPVPPDQNTTKQFFLQCDDPNKCGNDVIGFQIIKNPNHWSAARWYKSKGFGGASQELVVDGYDAVRDGANLYVNAANLGTDGKLHSNIYLISYNIGARPETAAVYEQIVANLRYNADILADPAFAAESTNLCDDATAASCSADLDCASGVSCLSRLTKLRRDVRRLADFRSIEETLSQAHDRTNSFPRLESGTFLRPMTTSAWPSWTENLSAEASAFLPADPLNKFVACPTDLGYDATTCFNSVESKFKCPMGSHVYWYTNQGPSNYKLETDLEVPSTELEWVRGLCSGGAKNGQYCLSNNDCPGGSCVFNSIQPILKSLFGLSTGATLTTKNSDPSICYGQEFGAGGTCGDGIINILTGSTLETCERGQTSMQPCGSGVNIGTLASVCNQTCNGWTPQTTNGVAATCQVIDCGNGVKEGVCSAGSTGGTAGKYCTNDSQCPGGSCSYTEACDDGANNGQYGYCSSTCGVGAGAADDFGPYCGDGSLAGIEQCDRGSASNGQYTATISPTPATSCSWNCTFPGPYCGDSIVQSNEQCDGNIRVGLGRCERSGRNAPTNSEAECRALGGTFIAYTECPTETFEGIVYPTYRTQTCNNGAPYSFIDSCEWNEMTDCQRLGACGNGIKEGTEECDDGNDSNNDICTNSCKNNVCGDGFWWTDVEACDFGVPDITRAPLLGGGKNGDPCLAAYTGTCNYCSTNCTYVTNNGQFCGDGVFTAGAERCDQSAALIVGTTTPPGYLTGTSICSHDCQKLCPPDYSDVAARFQQPSSSDGHEFTDGTDVNKIAVAPFRMGNGMLADIDIGNDVVQFPSPLYVLFVVDNSGSMTNSDVECNPGGGDETRIECLRKALTGYTSGIGASLFTEESAIGRLFASREDGDVRIGILEFGGNARYVSWGKSCGAISTSGGGFDGLNCNAGDYSPCYDKAKYTADNGGGPTTVPALTAICASNASTGSGSGFMDNSLASKLALSSTMATLSGDNNGTKAYLALKMAAKIMNDVHGEAGSRVVIFMSDGLSTDCCSGRTSGCHNSNERSQCVASTATIVTTDHCESTASTPDECEDVCDSGNNKVNTQEKCEDADGTLSFEYQVASCNCEWTLGSTTTSAVCEAEDGEDDCQFSDVEAKAMNEIDDDVYVFTVSYPSAIDPMRRWADPAISSGTTYSGFAYAGSSIDLLYDTIFNEIGVQVQVSNNESFVNSGGAPGVGDWMDSTTIPESGYRLLLDTTNLNADGPQNSYLNYWIRVLFAKLGTGPESNVNVSNLRWQYCPVTTY